MVAKAPMRVYNVLFERRSRRRYALGRHPYFPTLPGKEEENVAAVIAYVAPNSGPLERDVGESQGHLQAIGYFRKVTNGANPPNDMAGLKNLMCGARCGKETEKRHPPVSADDLDRLYDTIDWAYPDAVTLWRTSPIARFFMLRMGEYLAKGSKRAKMARAVRDIPFHWAKSNP